MTPEEIDAYARRANAAGRAFGLASQLNSFQRRVALCAAALWPEAAN